MSVLQAIVLGIVQGLAEFLPISSSAHLILVPWLFGWQDPGLAFDVALHWGTLVAVLAVFWRDWIRLIRAGAAQAFALVPGVSRSGSTISVGLFLGFTREEIARFSFLMSTPIIFGAGALKLPQMLREMH